MIPSPIRTAQSKVRSCPSSVPRAWKIGRLRRWLSIPIEEEDDDDDKEEDADEGWRFVPGVVSNIALRDPEARGSVVDASFGFLNGGSSSVL